MRASVIVVVAVWTYAVATASADTSSAGDAGRIDTHMHLSAVMAGRGGRSGERPPRGGSRGPSAGLSADDYAAAAGRLVEMMNRRGVEQALVVVVPSKRGKDDPETDYREIRDAVRPHAGRLRMMAGGARLGALLLASDPAAVTDRQRRRLEQTAEQLIAAGAAGFGEMLSMHLCMSKSHHYLYVAPDHPLYLHLADVAARLDVPIDLHLEAVPEAVSTPANLRRACADNPQTLPATIPAFERLLAHNRDARVVWQHIGWDNAGFMTVELLRRLLETHANLYLGLRVEDRLQQVGGGGPMPNRVVDSDGEIRPEWRRLIADFADRFVIGSDQFVVPAQSRRRWPQSFDETWPIVDQLPAELAAAVGRDNAMRIYKLE